MDQLNANGGLIPERARVLVIDDDPQIVRLFSIVLSEVGYQVLEGTRADDAIRMAHMDAPDLILMDVQMPGLDGFEATRRLKNDPSTRTIPIILITALDDPANKIKGLEAGADEFLPKPVDRSELLVRIRSMLRIKKYQEQLLHHSLSTGAGLPGVDGHGVAQERTRRLLVAVHDGRERSLVTSALEARGYLVVEGRDTADGQTSSAAPVDMLIGDSSLPKEGLRALQSGIPTLALVPQNDPESRVKLLDAGVHDLLVRPFDPRELVLRVDRLLSRIVELRSLEQRYRSALSSAAHDSLTKLSNHGYFRRFLDLEVKRSHRQKHPTSLIMLDLDNFKSKNDDFGHATGDMILVETARRIQQSVREIDLAARYGGEEFAVVLPYTDRAGAAVVAERIRAAIASVEFDSDSSSERLAVTASVGVAACPSDAASPEELIRSADELMYKAKESGKNRVCVRLPA